MDVREETKKSLLGKIVAAILALIALLFLVIWRAALSQVWAKVEAEVPKQALEAGLGLAGILIVLESAWIVYLLYSRRKLKNAPPPPKVAPPHQYRKLYGLLWDAEHNPHCPTDRTPLSHFLRNQRMGQLLYCPTCQHTFPLRDDNGAHVMLAELKKYLASQNPPTDSD